MNAMLEPRMVAANTQGFARSAQPGSRRGAKNALVARPSSQIDHRLHGDSVGNRPFRHTSMAGEQQRHPSEYGKHRGNARLSPTGSPPERRARDYNGDADPGNGHGDLDDNSYSVEI